MRKESKDRRVFKARPVTLELKVRKEFRVFKEFKAQTAREL